MARQTRTPTENGRPTLEQLVERAEAQDRMDESARTVSRPARTPGFGADEGRQAAFGDTGAAFAELMAGLDVGGHDAGSAGATATRPSPRPKAPAPATSREETPTVRPFRPATAAAAPVNAPVNAPGSPAAPGFAAAQPATFPTAQPVSTTAQPVSTAAKPVNPAVMPVSPAARPVSPAAPPAAVAAAQAAAAKVAAAQAASAKAAAAAAIAAAMPVSPATAPARPLTPLPNLAERIGGLSLSEVEIDEPSSASSSSDDGEFGTDHAVTPVSPTSAVPNTVPFPSPPRMADNEPVIHNLMSVGMPEAMARKITGGDTYAGVLSVLAARPSAPGIPDGPGEILVLAGDVNLGVPIAKHLLEQIGAGENHLLLAAPSTAGTGLHSSRLISTPEVAESRVEKLHAADHPWVVVMDAPVGGTDPLWVNDMCDAIGATAVWSIVDATRKTADTARHLRTLGEVEALVVHGVELTSDPASVLGLDLPIYSLDGKPATPHAWAAMLCARIAADVMPVAAAPRRVSRTVRQ
ncbi:hypothetical protein [Actinoplanes sp. NPDC051411]|uniref:hypothetical protein n=1 Tax=Actinoplanes sp. NPDC051411 TaxID=3155522 RepID=UPI00343D845A